MATEERDIWTMADLEPNTGYRVMIKAYDNAGNASKESMTTSVKTENEEVILTPETDIGKYVNYQADVRTYTTSSTYNGYGSSSQSITTETNLKWRIWNIDDTNLYLISAQPTTSVLYLQGGKGYNNGVTILDRICNTCYNSSYPGITARNLKIEDIIDVTTVNSTLSSYSKQPYEYASVRPPYIWTQNEVNSNDAINNRSIAYELTSKEQGSQTTIVPFGTAWYNLNMDVSSAYINTKYKELIIDAALNRTYWLSSRCVQPSSEQRCYFALQFVGNKGVQYDDILLVTSASSTSVYEKHAIRPLITIPLSSYKLIKSKTDETHFEIIPK